MADEQDEWNRLVRDGLTTEGDTNTRFPFQGMSRKFGRAWIEYCQVAWAANDGCLTEEEFCRINGGIPAKFFAAKIK
jgi:hypothetical protein